MSSQPTHPAVSEMVPGFRILSSTRIPLKIKPYFLQPLKNLPVEEKWKNAEEIPTYKKEPVQGMAQHDSGSKQDVSIFSSIPISQLQVFQSFLLIFNKHILHLALQHITSTYIFPLQKIRSCGCLREATMGSTLKIQTVCEHRKSDFF